jgi:multicomponent Na+:H+ antiporter subunit E
MRALTIAVWAYAVWLLLTWTVTAEQLTFGALLAISVGVAFASLGEVAAPWSVLDPRRFVALLRLTIESALRVVRANVSLSRRIWSPSRPLASGMVIVPTEMRDDGELAAVGVITSVIVDNQIVDLDRRKHVLQYHAVQVPEGSGKQKAESVNAPVEQMLGPVVRR